MKLRITPSKIILACITLLLMAITALLAALIYLSVGNFSLNYLLLVLIFLVLILLGIFFVKNNKERKNTEEVNQRLKSNEEKFRALIENSTDGLTLIAEDGTVLDMSPSGKKILGYNKEEIIGNIRPDLIHSDDRELVIGTFTEIIKDPTVIKTIEYRHKLPDGNYKWIECSYNNLLHEPYINAIVLNYRDIADRKKNEQDLKDSETRLADAQAVSKVGSWETNLSNLEVIWSPETYRIFEIDPKDFPFSHPNFLEFVHPEDRQKVDAAFVASLSKHTPNAIEHRITTAGGKLKFIEERWRIFFNDQGKAIRAVGTCQDITARVLSQYEIINEKNLSDSIINSLPGVFYLYTKEGKFLRWNKNFEKVTEYNSEEICRMHPLDFFDADKKKLIATKIDNTFNLGEDRVQTDFLSKSKKKIPYYFTGMAIEYGGITCLVGVGIDFSERVNAQETIKETTKQLRQLTTHLQSIREEERKKIGREIHDELGQQLTAIKMDVAWINKKIPEENSLLKNKLNNIITLLNDSNQSIRRILSDLRPVILDDYGLLESLKWLGHQFTLNTEIPIIFTNNQSQIKIAEAITTCIFRIYQETLTNISRHANAKNVLVSLKVLDDYIVLTIEDDGKGFDVATVKHNKSFGILGMRERVLSLNGEFILNTDLGKGTKINVSIPLINE